MSAYSGTEGILHLEQQLFDLVLLDLMLPGLSGERVLESVKEKNETPVIVISAKDELDTKVNLLTLGAEDYITKPFEIKEVKARVNVQLRKYNRIEPLKQIEHKQLVLLKSSICRQIAYIRKNETNMLITSEVSFGEIKKVVEEINKLNEEGKEIVARYMEKDAVLRQTITSLSHDIRTPLTSMDGYLQLLELEQEPEKLKQYIDVIMGRVKILKEILEELFLYTKLQDREYQLELQKENMTQIVFESVTAFYEEFKQNKMEPNISFPEEELEVVCHKGMMERVIQNIVKNSIIHGVSFVEIDLVKKNGQAVLRCKNDMKDASDINMELIFERFYKADISRSKSSSGLGLAITKELVEKMNGTIEANRIENMFQIEVRFDLW